MYGAAAHVGDPVLVLPVVFHLLWFGRLMTEHERPKGVLRVGDRVRFEDRVHTVVGPSGATVRLVDEHNTAGMVVFAHLMASDGFELLDATTPTPGLPPFGLLGTVPEVALRKARFYEKYLIEVETGLPPEAPKGAVPRPEYDPQWRTVNERVVAKAAELTASGNEVSDRTLFRLRSKWRDEGLWGLVDRRATRLSMAPGIGRVDERLVEAVLEVLAAQEDSSSGRNPCGCGPPPFARGGTADSKHWARTRSVIPTIPPSLGSNWPPTPKSSCSPAYSPHRTGVIIPNFLRRQHAVSASLIPSSGRSW